MAGGVLKGFGGVLLFLGILVLVVGLGAVAYGAYDQQENRDENGIPGVAPEGDSDRAEMNEALVLGGAGAAGIGALTIVIAVVLLVAGGARSRNEIRRAIDDVRAGQVAAQPSKELEGGGHMAASLPPAGRSSAATQAEPASSGARRHMESSTSARLGILMLAIVLVAGIVATFGFIAGEDTRGNRVMAFAEEYHEGQTGNTIVLGGLPIYTAGSVEPETAIPGIARMVNIAGDWSPIAEAAESLMLIVAYEDDGAWFTLDERQLENGAEPYTLAIPELNAQYLRFTAYPAGDGATVSQSYVLTTQFIW